MHTLKKDNKKLELELILATELGLLSSLKNKNIRFNPRPFTNKKEIIKSKNNLVDFHLEITKKIDQIIAQHENENQEEKTEINENIIEFREPHKKQPITPSFKTEISADNFAQKILNDEDLFEVELPTFTDLQTTRNIDDLNDFTLVKKIDTTVLKKDIENNISKEQPLAFASIKFGKKPEKTQKKASKNKPEKKKKRINNGFTRAKKDLETTKMKLEKKKKEIERIEKLAKEKKEELKKKKILRKEREKQKKLEFKKQTKEKKLQEIEAKKLQKQKEKELKTKEKKKTINKLKHAKEAKIKEKQKKKLEKQKQLEAKQLLKDKKIREKKLKKHKKIKPKKEKQTKEKKEIKIKETPVEQETIKDENIPTEEETNFDEEVKEALEIIDDLLGKLPEETIDEFVQSEDFAIYEKVVSKYKNK